MLCDNILGESTNVVEREGGRKCYYLLIKC